MTAVTECDSVSSFDDGTEKAGPINELNTVSANGDEHNAPLARENHDVKVSKKEGCVEKQTMKEKKTHRDVSSSSDYCAEMFYEGYCSIPDCQDNHRLDMRKIDRGICVYEMQDVGSCPYSTNCMFTHQIPAKIKQSEDIKRDVQKSLEKMNKKRKNREKDGRTNISNSRNVIAAKIDKKQNSMAKDTTDEERNKQSHPDHKEKTNNERQNRRSQKKDGEENNQRHSDQRNINEGSRKSYSRRNSKVEKKTVHEKAYNIDDNCGQPGSNVDWLPFLELIRTMIQNQQNVQAQPKRRR